MSVMEENEKENGFIYSKAVRAGKRTYFFDVKATKADEKYLIITESKRRFDNEQNKFVFDKHKIFLYKEDFENFEKGLNTVLDFINTGILPVEEEEVIAEKTYEVTDFSFEDLAK